MGNLSISAADLEEFKTEAIELLDAAEKRLLELDAGQGDFSSAYDEIFRAFHSLKGAAGMMEITDIQAHTHEMENLLVGLKGSASISDANVSIFLKGIDVVRSLMNEGIMAGGTAPVLVPESVPADLMPTAAVEEFIQESEEILERLSDALQRMEKGDRARDLLDGLYRDVHTIKGTAYLFSFDLLGDIAHAMESALEKVRAGTHLPSPVLINVLFKSLSVIEAVFKRIKDQQEGSDFAPLVSAVGRALSQASEKLEVVEAEVAPMSERQSPTPTPTSCAPVEVLRPAAASDGEGAGSIRVPVALLDGLMTLMGEMVLVRNQVLQFSNKSDDAELLSMSKRLNVVTSEIQEEMMKTRMQPLGNVLGKFNRVVRDLAQELGKDIALHLQGAETELDKTLLEAIKDPLTHIVRNSCDHGIETPDVRRRAGKPAAGNITVKAYHEGGQVVVEVSDDGKGLHREALVRKAVEKGIMVAGAAEKLTDKEAFGLIFHAGFSTAAKITNVSGRGVGMDVVRTNIERIGGTVDLASVAGQGTTIKLKVPLTLAIVPALIIKTGEGIYAIPQVKLEELVRVDETTEQQMEHLHGAPVLRLRNHILPLVDLNQVLGLTPAGAPPRAVNNIAVLNAEQFSFGVIVDEIHDTADIVVKPLNRLIKSLQVYSGGTVLGDGGIALILDVIGLAKHAQLSHDAGAQARDEQGSAVIRSEVQDFIMVRVNSPTRHAIALSYVHRLEEFRREDVELSGQDRVIRYRDTVLPLVDANRHLGLGSADVDSGPIPVVVIERAGRLFGIEVDGILDTLSTMSDLDRELTKNPCAFGTLTTPEGLVVVVNPFELIARDYPHLFTEPAVVATPIRAGVRRPRTDGPLRILLVEDTVFFRKAIQAILVERGYLVTNARDGQEALDLLSANPDDFDMIVSDIEMPRLNGFELAAAVRRHPRLAQLPMLAISSRSDQGHRSQGAQAGFDVYLEKLKSPVLIAAINELTAVRKVSA